MKNIESQSPITEEKFLSSNSSQMNQPLYQLSVQLLEEVDRKMKAKYVASTYSKMQEQIRRINKDVFSVSSFNLLNCLNHSDQVIAYIEKCSPTIGKVLCNTVRQFIVFCDFKDTEVHQAYYQCYGRIVTQLKKQPYSEVDESEIPQFHWDDVGQLWKKLHLTFQNKPQISLADYQIYLVYSLYYLLPPLRPQEWISSKIKVNFFDDENVVSDNLIDMNGRRLIVSNYKTCSKYGVRIIPFGELSEENGRVLFEIIDKYLKLYPQSEYLFTTRTGKPILEQNFSKIFGKVTLNGQKTNARQLRNLFISEKIMDSNISLESRQRLAYIMGHTLQTQTFIYSKYSHQLHPRGSAPLSPSKGESSSSGEQSPP